MKMEMANPSPLISVVLPFYNAPFLSASIESILNQSLQDFELILVDNASTDHSSEVGRCYASDPRVHYIREENRGVVHAANTGIIHSKGTYIARMDADDIAFPDRLEVQSELLLNNEQLDVVSGLVEYMGPQENKGFIHYVNWLNTIRSEIDISMNQFVEFPLANPTMMIRKSIFDKYGMYMDGDFPEDYEFFLRLQSKGVQMRKSEAIVLKWRDTDTRLTRTDQRYSQDAFFKVKAKYLAEWLRKHNPFHPNIWVWGAGRLSRRRSDLLKAYGIEIVSYIDLEEGNNTHHYDNLPEMTDAFIVSYVSNRGARSKIKQFLVTKGYQEGKHYIIAA